MNNIISGIYKIINKNNQKFYIGSSKNIFKRWREHKRDLNLNIHHSIILQRAWNKNGSINFEFIILKTTNINKKTLIAEEQKFLDIYKPYLKNVGYNISKSALGPTGVLRNDLKNYNICEKSKKIYQYNINGKFIKEWSSIRNAAKSLNISPANISRACLKKIKISKGYIWRFKTDIKNKNILIKELEILNKKQRPIIQYDLKGKKINTWRSMRLAAKTLNIQNSHIHSVCNGTRKTTGGFKWKYK